MKLSACEAPKRFSDGERNTSLVPAEKLTAEPPFDDPNTVVRVSVPELNVPRPYSHSTADWWAMTYSHVSALDIADPNVRKPSTAPARVTAPVPVVVVVSLTRPAVM